MLLALFALACDHPYDVPPAAPAPFTACAAPAGGYDETPTEEVAVVLTGAISAAGTGDTDNCFEDAGFGSSIDADRDAAWWITANAEDGTPWTAAIGIPNDAAGPIVGDEVTVAFDYRPDVAPLVANLEIRQGTGELRAWVGVGGDLADLTPPAELSFAPGPEVTHDADHCGVWSERDVEVTAAGSTVDLPYGGSVSAGGLTVLHGGYDTATEERCADWFAIRAALAATQL